ncbi:MAG: ABC transporter substrate-binding protein [Anaerolineaceae bacterium]|nr:MAG: ABC transporter substrate-binding protein [Anaerolineaceae bacterium]
MSACRFVFAIVLVLGLTACSGVSTPQVDEDESVHIRLLMGYRPDVQFAPLYVAAERGYYEDAGIDIEFSHMPETEALQLVGANEIQFAIVSGEQTPLARAQGLPVVYVMAWWQDFPVGIAASRESGIETPVDLVGKRVGIPGLYGASYVGYRALLSTSGVSEMDVTLDAIGYNQVEALYEGQEDAVVIYANNEPVQLEAQGFPVNVIRVADYVHLASNGLITNEETIQDRPDLVRRMVDATLSGLRDAIEDPDMAYEVAKLYVEGLEQADEAVMRGVLNASIEFWKAERLGYSDPASWENMQRVLIEMGLLEGPIDLSQAFTNEYLP